MKQRKALIGGNWKCVRFYFFYWNTLDDTPTFLFSSSRTSVTTEFRSEFHYHDELNTFTHSIVALSWMLKWIPSPSKPTRRYSFFFFLVFSLKNVRYDRVQKCISLSRRIKYVYSLDSSITVNVEMNTVSLETYKTLLLLFFSFSRWKTSAGTTEYRSAFHYHDELNTLTHSIVLNHTRKKNRMEQYRPSRPW